jgi:hypothetical protein
MALTFHTEFFGLLKNCFVFYAKIASWVKDGVPSQVREYTEGTARPSPSICLRRLRCLHEISPGGIPPLAGAFRASTSHSDLSEKQILVCLHYKCHKFLQ